jgi:hypothetical protein
MYMRKLKHRLALTAAALAFTPITVMQLIATGNTIAVELSAMAAMLAGVVFVLAAVQMMEAKW